MLKQKRKLVVKLIGTEDDVIQVAQYLEQRYFTLAKSPMRANSHNEGYIHQFLDLDIGRRRE